MKKLKLFSTLLATALLTACAGATNSQQPMTAPAEEPAASAAAAPQRQQGAPLHRINMCRYATMNESAAYAVMNVNDAGKYFMTKIDPESGEQSVLCSRANCAHNAESCPAYLAQIANGCVPSRYAAADGSQVYWFIDGRYNNSEGAYIDRTDANGENRIRMAEGNELPDMGVLDIVYSDGSSLYIEDADYIQKRFRVLCVNENGVKTVYETSLPEGVEEYRVIGCWQDQLLVRETASRPENPLIPKGDAATEEELRAWLQEEDAKANKVQEKLWLLSTAGEMSETPFTWEAGQGSQCQVQGSMARFLSESGELTEFDLQSGETSTRQLELPGAVRADYSIESIGAWQTVEIQENGQYTAYLLNYETGETRMQPITWYKDSVSPQSPRMAAHNDVWVFAHISEELYNRQAIGSDGVPYTAQSGNGIYGFAKVEDYLAGNADWKAVTLLGTDFYE